MKKLILLLLIMFILPFSASAEDFPPSGSGIKITAQTNPIYYGYMKDYAVLLRDALLEKTFIKIFDMGVDMKYTITRDGQIKDFDEKCDIIERFNKERLKEAILSVKPLPFRDGMDLDEMEFYVSLWFDNYEGINLEIWRMDRGNGSCFRIGIAQRR